jgi:predicted exporter
VPFFADLYRVSLPHVRLLTAAALLLLAVCALFDSRLEVREDITSLMPTEPADLAEQFALLREAPFTQGLNIAVGGEDPSRSARLLSDALRSPEIPRVLSGSGRPFNPQLLPKLCRSIPGLMDTEAQASLPGRLEEDAMRTALKHDHDLLLAPQGIALRGFLAIDPLGICAGVLKGIAPAARAPSVQPEEGQILSADGSHALVTAEPAFSMSDSDGASKVMDRVRSAVKTLPPGTETVVVGGHRHTEENAAIIKEDVRRILPVSMSLLALAFIIFIRTVKGLCVLLLPSAALLVAAAVTSVVFKGLSGIVLGFGSVVLGITADYAIHVYYALRNGQDAATDLQRISGPVLLGAGTTLAAFAAFLTSSIPSIVQMTVFAVSGLLAALVFALWLLPLRLGPGGGRSAASSPTRPMRLKRIPPALVWAALGIALAFLLHSVPVNGDIRTLSYVSTQTAKDETRMSELFGGLHEQGLYAAKGKSLEEALRANDRIWKELGRVARENGWNPAEMLTGPAQVLPALATQAERIVAWRKFWDAEARAALSRLDSLAAEAGFSAEAFAPFKEWIAAEPAPMTPELLASVGMETALMPVRLSGDAWLVYNLMRTDKAPPGLLQALNANGAVLISGSGFRTAMDKAVRADLLRFGGLSLLAILAMSFFALRSPLRMGVALLPAACGLACVLAVFRLTGMELNIFHAMSLPLVMSLSVDYGIFILAYLEGKLGKETRTGVLLSGITTLSGFGMLMPARHPALHCIGLTVSLGLVAALVAALVLLPLFAGPEQEADYA